MLAAHDMNCSTLPMSCIFFSIFCEYMSTFVQSYQFFPCQNFPVFTFCFGGRSFPIQFPLSVAVLLIFFNKQPSYSYFMILLTTLGVFTFILNYISKQLLEIDILDFLLLFLVNRNQFYFYIFNLNQITFFYIHPPITS